MSNEYVFGEQPDETQWMASRQLTMLAIQRTQTRIDHGAVDYRKHAAAAGQSLATERRVLGVLRSCLKG